MGRPLVTLFVITLIIATALGQGVIIQGPEDAVLPVSAQAKFSCVANKSLNHVTGINWLARTASGAILTSTYDLNITGITILPSASKFTSKVTVEGDVSNNGTELICSVGVIGSIAVQSSATLILYGAPDPVSGFSSSISGIHSINLSWIPISFSFPFNYSIWIRHTASNAIIENVLLNQNMTSYIYKGNTSFECEEYNFTIRTVNGAGNSSESGVLTLTLPDVPSSATINNSLVSFEYDRTPLITLIFNAPRACPAYPVIFYYIMLRDQDSSNISLMIPAENARSNGSHVTISFNNGSIEYDKDYSLSITAVNDVGGSEASQERRIVTSSLQSINASLHGYQLRVECHFANGSRSAGCFVIVALTNGTELMNRTLTRSQPDTLTSNTTISLTKDTLSLPLVVVGRDCNITGGDPGLVKITSTPTIISVPMEPIASMTVSMVVESSYELNSQTPVPTFVSTSPRAEGAVLYIALFGCALVLGILILLIPLIMSLVVLVRYCKERKNGSRTTIQPIQPSNGVTRDSPKQEHNGGTGTHTDTTRSQSTIRSEQVEAATGSSPVTALDMNNIRLLMEREGGDAQGLVQPYGVTNLIHKGLEVPVYQDVQDTDYRKYMYMATPVPLHSDLPPNPYDQSSETPPLVPPRNQSNRSQTQLQSQRIYHVLESPGSSQGSTECAETPPPLYDEVSAVVQDMQSQSPKTATPTNSPTQTPPLPSRLGCHTNWKRNGAAVANGYKEPARVSSSPCFSPSPQLPLHLFSSSSPSPLLTNGAVIDSSDALTPPLPVLIAEDDDVFSSSASNTIETTPSPIARARHQTYQKLYRRHSQSQCKTMRAVTPHTYAVPSRSGSMPRGYQRPVPRGNYQRQKSCQANLRCHRVHPVVGDAQGVGEGLLDTVNIKKSTSIPSAIMISTARKRSSSVPGEEEVYNALQYRGYTQGNWTLKRTLV